MSIGELEIDGFGTSEIVKGQNLRYNSNPITRQRIKEALLTFVQFNSYYNSKDAERYTEDKNSHYNAGNPI